jgi:NADPH:quinone reductase
MKAWLLNEPGAITLLRLSEAPVPDPGAGEVRVRVHAAGLNPIDYKLIERGHPDWHYPHIPGVDGAGVVEMLGAGVRNWRPGERVFFCADLRRQGTFADFIVVAADAITNIPPGVSMEDAAAIPCAGMTACHALHRRLHVRNRQTALIYGASGGVGGFAVQLAKVAGARVIATYSGHDREYVQGLGAHEVIDWRSEDLATMVDALTDRRGVDAIVDVVGPENATRSLDMLAYSGGIACIAGLPDLSKLDPFTIAPSIHEIALGAAYRTNDSPQRRELARMGRMLGKLLANGNIKSLLSEIVAFDALPEALTRLQTGQVRGKVVTRLTI